MRNGITTIRQDLCIQTLALSAQNIAVICIVKMIGIYSVISVFDATINRFDTLYAIQEF